MALYVPTNFYGQSYRLSLHQVSLLHTFWLAKHNCRRVFIIFYKNYIVYYNV